MELATRYLGLHLKNPLVCAAGPFSKNIDMAKRLEDAGVSALVMYSLFEERINQQIHEVDTFLNQGSESYAEATDYFPPSDTFQLDPDEYLEHVAQLKSALDIPIIGSLNGVSSGGWVQYARSIQEAGADALELNIYFLPTDSNMAPATVEDDYFEVVREVKKNVTVPLAVKVAPFFTNVAWMCRARRERCGCARVVQSVLQPDINLEALDVEPRISLSSSEDLRLPLRWIAILRDQIEKPLAVTSGVHTPQDVLKALMVGADIVMMMAAFLKNGPEYASEVLSRVDHWLEEHEYESLDQLRGSMSHRSVAEPAAFERAHYVRALNLFKMPQL